MKTASLWFSRWVGWLPKHLRINSTCIISLENIVNVFLDEHIIKVRHANDFTIGYEFLTGAEEPDPERARQAFEAISSRLCAQ